MLGLSGLLILVLAARELGAEDYVEFGLFWSALYFVVAALSGVQQEVTRASAFALRSKQSDGASLISFGLVVASAAGLFAAVTCPLWVPPTLGSSHYELVAPVAVGSAVYVLTTVVAAVCAAHGRWGRYASAYIVEGVFRAAAVAAALALTQGSTVAAWAVVAAYPVVLGCIGVPLLRSRSVRLTVDDSMRRLTSNTVKAMVAATSIAAMVNGFPLLMATFSRDASTATIGSMTLAVMLTRAPLLVPLAGAQTLLITVFAGSVGSLRPLMTRLMVQLVAIVAVLAVLAGWAGPFVLRRVVGENFDLPGYVLALLVVSSGALGALSLTSPALMATDRHNDYAFGWVLSTTVSILTLAFAPGGLEVRAPVALIVGPLIGVGWHVLALARGAAMPVRRQRVP
ncbi:MAG: hypothetical protein ABWY58_04215 [Aeromicrobium sp.]